MQIGFNVSGEEDQEVEVGLADSIQTEHWAADLPEYFFNAWTRFCLVYGIFASIRDLILTMI